MAVHEMSVEAPSRNDEEVVVYSRWFEPDEPDPQLPLLFCIPGGTYNHRYWDLDVPGGGYSFAREMTARGYSVVAIDNLGTGASSRPATPIGLADLAEGADATLQRALSTLSPQWAVGIGHSMGGYTLLTQQAMTRSCDAIAVLGSVIGPTAIVPLPDEMVATAREGHDSRIALAAAAQPVMASDYQPTTRVGSGMDMFHMDDVPAAVLDADAAQTATVLPARAAAEALVPWFTADAAAAVDVPVFLAFGELDVSPAPHEEPSYFTAATDVTLFVLERSGHCHNMATTRFALWNRLDGWIRSLAVSGLRSR